MQDITIEPSTIIIKNNGCQISDAPYQFLTKLDLALAYRIPGAEYSKAYKMGRWDGIKRLLTPDLRFPYGLLGRVKDLFKQNSVPFIIEDQRDLKSPIQSIDIIPTLSHMNKTPFPYQLEVLEAVKQEDCGIIRVATGGGKTLICALIAAYFGKTTIIYVIGNDLLHQIHTFFSSVFREKIGMIGDGICDIARINIASVWTVGKALGLKDDIVLEDDDDERPLSEEKYVEVLDLLDKTKVHVFDECHLAGCSTIQEISKHIIPEHIYGLSASPWRDDNADLLIECVFGSKIVDISASKLIGLDFLVKPVIKFIEVDPYPEKLKKNYQTVYSKYVINNEVRNGLVARGAEKLVEQGYQTLVLFNNIKHGEILYKEISKKIPCILLSGKDTSEVRLAAKAKLEAGEIRCVIASKIFDIGVDIPSLSGLILAGGGKSSVRTLQRIGRVLRKFPNKKMAAVIDFKDNAHYLKDHAKIRHKVYSSEPAFQVFWPNKSKR